MDSINTRLKDLREPYGGTRMKQIDVARALNLPVSSINEYETEGVFVSSDVIIKYSQYFNVSSDYILGLTNIKNIPNAELRDLQLSDKAMEKLKTKAVDPRLLSEFIEHDEFDELMIDASIYIDGFVDQKIQQINSLVDFQKQQILATSNDSKIDKKDIKLLDSLHVDQDAYFAHDIFNRFKTILHDIKEKHSGYASSADSIDNTDYYKTIENAMNNCNGNKFAKLIAGIKAAMGSSAKIKNNDKTKQLSESALTVSVDENAAELLASQSQVIEPDARKRRKFLKKDKMKKDS